MTQSQFAEKVYPKMTWEEKFKLCDMLRLFQSLQAYYFRVEMAKKYKSI